MYIRGQVKNFQLGREVKVFELDENQPLGILLQRTINKLPENYSINDVISALEKEHGFEKEKMSMISRFSVAKTWGIFGETKLPTFLEPGTIKVLDVSLTPWNVRALLVGLVLKRIFFERTKARRKEELGEDT